MDEQQQAAQQDRLRRAELAWTASGYNSNPDEAPQETLADLITDLLHLADKLLGGGEFEESGETVVERALMNYRAERAGQYYP